MAKVWQAAFVRISVEKVFTRWGTNARLSLVTALRFIISGVSCGSPRSKAEQGTEGAQQRCSCAVTIGLYHNPAFTKWYPLGIRLKGD